MGRLFLLVILAVVPALVIQAWNEYDQRIARQDDILHYDRRGQRGMDAKFGP